MNEGASVTVRLFAGLRAPVGAPEIDLQAADVRGLLRNLVARYPALHEELFDRSGRLRDAVKVMVNGRNVEFLEGLDTRLETGDAVAVFPVVAGG